MDAMVDKILVCESTEPMIPLKNDDNVNVAEEDDSECSVDPDPAIIPPTLRTVAEHFILKMTKWTVTYNNGITEIVRLIVYYCHDYVLNIQFCPKFIYRLQTSSDF